MGMYSRRRSSTLAPPLVYFARGLTVAGRPLQGRLIVPQTNVNVGPLRPAAASGLQRGQAAGTFASDPHMANGRPAPSRPGKKPPRKRASKRTARMSDIVRLEIADHIAVVTLNRPEKKNALNDAMFEAIAATGEALKQRDDVRAVILTGAGGDFCSGLDTANFAGMAAGIEETRRKLVNPPPGEAANFFQKPCHVWQELDVPVIAAVEGVCLGGGLQIALAADFRFVAPDARLSILETKWGIIPDMGITQNLPRLMRADLAKELIMTARMFTGEEAGALGLATRVVADPMAQARAFAAELAARSPQAMRAAKRLVEEAWTLPPREGLALEGRLQAQIMGTPEQVETVMAVIQKRAPNYG